RFPRPDGLEEIPEMRPQIIIVVAPITYALWGRLISRFGIVLVVPLLEVGVLQAAREPVAVIAGSQVNPGLRGVAEAKLCKFDDALGTHKPSDFRGFSPQRQAHVHRDVCVFEPNRMHVGRIAPMFPPVNATKGLRSFGCLIDTANKL